MKTRSSPRAQTSAKAFLTVFPSLTNPWKNSASEIGPLPKSDHFILVPRPTFPENVIKMQRGLVELSPSQRNKFMNAVIQQNSEI